MGLINLRTNLKDLKFGNDQYKNGSSNEPFIQTRIPATDAPLPTGALSLSAEGFSESLGDIILGAGVGAAGGAIIGGGVGAIAGTVVGAAAAAIGGGVDINAQFQLPAAGTGGSDFLLRGGLLLPNRIVKDTARLAKYFTTTDGILFTIKQNLLSRSGAKTQFSPSLINEGIYTPLSTLAGVIGSPFGLHPNKQGLNPLLGITSGLGYIPNQYITTINDSEYADFPENNRLIGLFGSKFLNNGGDPNPMFLTGKAAKNNISSDPNFLISYGGGPGSLLGIIGKTRISRSNPSLSYNISDYNGSQEGAKINYLTYGYLDFHGGKSTVIKPGSKSTLEGTSLSDQFNQRALQSGGNTSVFSTPFELAGVSISPDTTEESFSLELDNWNRDNKWYVPTSKQTDFRKRLRDQIESINDRRVTLMSFGLLYEPGGNQTLEQRTNLGDPGNPSEKNVLSYVRGISKDDESLLKYKGAASKNSYDKINAFPIYQSQDGSAKQVNDLVQFRIGIINNDKPKVVDYIHFRAFLDQINDSYTSNWDPVKYIGRGENFYTYAGFDRKVSLSWTVAAQSKVELIPMYKKLNYLASIMAPDYSAGGYMRGNIITLTIGGYFYNQPGIITGFSYEMNEENDSWEIGVGDARERYDDSIKELPHIIRVRGFNFIPIHDFVPRKQKLSFDQDGFATVEVPADSDQRYIALKDANGSLYDKDSTPNLTELAN